jgi:hypothetical protein
VPVRSRSEIPMPASSTAAVPAKRAPSGAPPTARRATARMRADSVGPQHARRRPRVSSILSA